MALHACPEWDVPNGVFGWRFSKGRGMPVPDRGVPDRGVRSHVETTGARKTLLEK
jgi:hypothetical protein